jgi:hypothetical protein
MADALDDTSVDVTPTRNLRSRTAPVIKHFNFVGCKN